MTAPQALEKVRHDVVVGAYNKLQRDALLVENCLQLPHGTTNLRTTIVVNARQNVRGASEVRHTVGDKGAGHRQ